MVEDDDLGHAANPQRERHGGSPDRRPRPSPQDPDLRCAGWRPPACRRGSQRPCRGPPPLGQGQRGCRQFLRPRWHRGVGEREATSAAPRRQVICFGPPRSVRGLLVGPRRPVPRPRARRGASVLRHHQHRVRRHHNHHHRRVHRRHHHLGVTSPRGTSSNNNNSSSNSSNSNSSDRPASRVAGKSRAPSECTPFSISLFIMSTGLNLSFACQGFLPLFSQGHASSARYHARRVWLPAAGICWEWRRRSAPGCCNYADGYRSPNDGDAIEYTVGSGGGGPNCTYPHHRGRHGGVSSSIPPPTLEETEVVFRRRARSSAGSPPPGAVSCPSGSS
jgi:hypothetical protein